MEIMVVEEGGYISNEEANKNWGKWAKMGRQKMSIIKELDEWISDKKRIQKKINFDNTDILFIKNQYFNRLIINVSVFRYKEKITMKKFDTGNCKFDAHGILNFIIGHLYDNAKYSEASADEIHDILSRSKKND